MSRTKSTSTEIKKELSSIQSELDSINLAKEKLSKKAMDVLKGLINKSDLIEAVRWNQYTPYFNDGDACEFGVNEIEFKFSEQIHNPTDKLNKSSKKKDEEEEEEEEEDEDDDSEAFISSYSLDRFLEERKDVLNFKDVDAAQRLCNDLQHVHASLTGMGDALKDLFGDHIQVTVTRKGVETEEYEHE